MQNWIDAKIELPKESGRYLTICNNVYDVKTFKYHPLMGGFWNETEGVQWTIGTASLSDYITHWMPLPAPPNE